MRVNARFDPDTQAQLEYIVATTGQAVSQVVRECVATYYVQLRAREQGPKGLLALVGRGDSGRADVASQAKRLLAEGLTAKVRPARKA